MKVVMWASGMMVVVPIAWTVLQVVDAVAGETAGIVCAGGMVLLGVCGLFAQSEDGK